MATAGGGPDTRELLLERGHALASEVGLHGLTIGRLAGDVGISKAGIYTHFESKEHLLEEVLARAVRAFERDGIEPALNAPPGEPRLRALFDAWMEWTEASPVPGGCIFVSSVIELDDRPGPLREYLLQALGRWKSTLAEVADRGRREGHFREDLDPEQLVFELQSIVLGFHHYRHFFRSQGAESRARYAFESLVRRARRPEPPSVARPA